MSKNNILNLAALLLVIIGIIMIYLGGFQGSKLILPPLISGIGFLVIAWALNGLKSG